MTIPPSMCEDSAAEDARELLRQLHDGPLQLLEYMAADGHGRIVDANAFRELARRAADEIRRTLDHDCPDAPTDLEGAIHDLALRAAGHGQVVVDVEVQGSCRSIAVADVAPYVRAAGEAVNNAVRHSGATHVCVHCRRTKAGEVEIDVLDDGVGMTSDDLTHGSGVRCSIIDRVSRAGGRVEIQARASRGTRVRIRGGRRDVGSSGFRISCARQVVER